MRNSLILAIVMFASSLLLSSGAEGYTFTRKCPVGQDCPAKVRIKIYLPPPPQVVAEPSVGSELTEEVVRQIAEEAVGHYWSAEVGYTLFEGKDFDSLHAIEVTFGRDFRLVEEFYLELSASVGTLNGKSGWRFLNAVKPRFHYKVHERVDLGLGYVGTWAFGDFSNSFSSHQGEAFLRVRLGGRFWMPLAVRFGRTMDTTTTSESETTRWKTSWGFSAGVRYYF